MPMPNGHYTAINDKNCSLSIALTAMDQKLQKSKKMILPNITSSKSQRDAEYYHHFMIFAVFEP